MAMVETGQPPVVERGYRNPTRPGLRMEVLTFAEIAGRLSGAEFRRVHRLDFHHLTLVHGGTGTGMVDFLPTSLGPGTLLHIRPGQVQRLPTGADGSPAHLDATSVLFTPDFPPRLPAAARLDVVGPELWRPAPPDHGPLRDAFAGLAAEYAAYPGAAPDLSRELLGHLLAALLLRVARLPSPDGRPRTSPDEPYARFRRELERSFTTLRQAHDYAARLGYSVKTLNRACRRATGQTAKQLVDARVVLEAKRLLAHTDLPVAAISHRLSFSEPTNFGKFFTRTTGVTPGVFREGQR
ncbi:AraC family transcriptional regulator [Streptomyces roseirectus]|uniref:AraC family transcriptional regulator n=1 Tax=Streptomyces roseirectus TaxID=2768066 RepID=A0A7H0IQT8_9ACTN|nr:helix-turn-helix transcriptional regulator [Streptomyces roseirectus]QNP75154.1 AraC family transcriptional regulator [Streptomyces roseirectus]